MPLLCDAIDGISYNGLHNPGLKPRERELLLPEGSYRGHSISLSGGFGNQWFRQSNVVLHKKSGKITVITFHGVVLQLPALGKLSDFGDALTLFAPEEAALKQHALQLKQLIQKSDAIFTDSATIDAVLITRDNTWIAIADGSLPFTIGGVFQSKTALTQDIKRASAELAVPIELMQLWSQGLSNSSV